MAAGVTLARRVAVAVAVGVALALEVASALEVALALEAALALEVGLAVDELRPVLPDEGDGVRDAPVEAVLVVPFGRGVKTRAPLRKAIRRRCRR